MRLCLSSDAYPAGGLPELTQATRRCALDGLELWVGAGHRHGVGEQVLSGEHAPVLWLLLPRDSTPEALVPWAETARELGAGLVIQEPVSELPEGVQVALMHGNRLEAVQEAAWWAAKRGAHTCWHVDPGLAEGEIAGVLEATLPTLAHVRLPGSGPEADRTSSPVTGALMGRLALAGYQGTIALAASPGADPEMWRRWLFETRGWGCGTAAEKQARAEARKQMETL